MRTKQGTDFVSLPYMYAKQILTQKLINNDM